MSAFEILVQWAYWRTQLLDAQAAPRSPARDAHVKRCIKEFRAANRRKKQLDAGKLPG